MESIKKFFRKWIYWILIGVICLGAATAVLLFLDRPEVPDPGTLHMTFNGERYETIEYGFAYDDPGASAVFDESQPVEVETIGKVDHNQLGSYKLKYRATENGLTVTAYRVVTVKDTTAPQIQLQTKEGHYTEPGKPYQEEGFTATDNHDGDLTASVKAEEKDGVVTYTVTDSSGNSTSVVREIVYFDPLPPVIALNGSPYMAVKVGETFNDPGVTASDNCDGEISALVTVNGRVDSNVPGVYILEYIAKDSFGNQASTKRTVCVIPESDTPIVPPTGKVIYLTFDDGPGPHTDRLLDILAKYNVKATFFVVNTGYISKIQRAASEGHTVAIHTATHRFDKVYASDEAYYEDLYTMQGIIEQYTGQKPMLLRFPGGSSNTISQLYNKGIMTRLTKSVVENGFAYFDWNVDSKDAGGAKTPEEVFENVTSGISKRNTAVVLQHDLYDYSVDAVEQIILWGIANGYTFAPITADSPGCHHGVSN